MACITADLSNGYRVEIRNDRHVWSADEPIDTSKTDEGPSPYELLLGALAACTLITLRMVADREGIPLDHISARFDYERVHGEDCLKCEEEGKPYLHQIETNIFLDGAFTDAQRARLERVAARCPVHRTLEEGVSFTEHVHVG